MTQGPAPVAGGLKLRAEDEADIAVFAACLQSARTRPLDMTYLRAQRRFVLLFDRYCWEASAPELRETGGLPPSIVRCGMHFDGVTAVATQGLDAALRDQGLDLLTIICRRQAAGAFEVHLLFAGGADLRLGVECIDAGLADLEASRSADPGPD